MSEIHSPEDVGTRAVEVIGKAWPIVKGKNPTLKSFAVGPPETADRVVDVTLRIQREGKNDFLLAIEADPRGDYQIEIPGEAAKGGNLFRDNAPETLASFIEKLLSR
jgi:hypothetical protein